jgi:hypothetical protein
MIIGINKMLREKNKIIFAKRKSIHALFNG